MCYEKSVSLKNLDNSLVGYWDMETLSGILLKDLSGNGNEGVFSWGMNSTGSLTGGILGMGRSFNGDLDYINIANSSSLNPKEITISAIINTFWNGIKSNYFPRILWKGANPSSEQYALWQTLTWSISPFTFRLNPINKLTAQVQWYESSPINSYVNITVTYNLKETKIFINWKLDNLSSDNYSWIIIDSTKNLIIWNTSWSSWLNRAFYWTIDDIKIYNRALSDSEIKQHAKAAGF